MRQTTLVDWVILEEVCEVVKFEAMNLVDNLLLVNSDAKMKQLEKVKKHKHVVFQEEPTIIEYEKYMKKAPRPLPNSKRQRTDHQIVEVTTTTISDHQKPKVQNATPKKSALKSSKTTSPSNKVIVVQERTEEITLADNGRPDKNRNLPPEEEKQIPKPSPRHPPSKP